MDDDLSIHNHVRDTVTMLELTAKFDCLEWASKSVQSSISSAWEIQKLSLLSEAYRTAAVLYGKRVLRAFKASIETTAPDSEELVLRLLGVIDSLKCDPALFKCLLWPTFIIGLECQTHGEQQVVIGFLKMLWDLTFCLNVINSSKILRDHWKRKHFDGNLTSERSDLNVIEQGWLLIWSTVLLPWSVDRRFQPDSFYYYDRPSGLMTHSTAKFRSLRATCDNFLNQLELTNHPLRYSRILSHVLKGANGWCHCAQISKVAPDSQVATNAPPGITS